MMEVIYLFHDGFIINTKEAILVFDFWRLPSDSAGDSFMTGKIPFINDEDRDKPVYVFVSHHHKDHFSKEIFSWADVYPSIHYILSKDTAKMGKRFFNPTSIYNGPKAAPEQVTVLKTGETAEFKEIRVKAFGSTDIGNSYLVETTEGKRIFHAGDLNAWIWKEESTEKEVDEAIGAYSSILDDIASETKDLDVAMFPVDARIGTDFFTGAKMFVRKIRVAHFFPMHFELWENEEERIRFHHGALDFDKYADMDYGEYIGLTAPGDSFMTV